MTDWAPRVLLAEDNQVNQEVATAMLEDIGCKVTVVPDGRQAVETFEQQRPVQNRTIDLRFWAGPA